LGVDQDEEGCWIEDSTGCRHRFLQCCPQADKFAHNSLNLKVAC
jgi:hypothetical protein